MKYITCMDDDKSMRRLQGIRRRARTLFSTGYTYVAVPGSVSIFQVSNDKKVYTVDMDKGNCACEGFPFSHTCKHLEALRLEEQRIRTLVAASPAMYARALTPEPTDQAD